MPTRVPPWSDLRHAACIDTGMRSGPSLLTIVYVIIGVIVANGHAYFVHLTAIMPILSAILAVLLWPLILLGVNLHLR